jgi:hypothetical protein
MFSSDTRRKLLTLSSILLIQGLAFAQVEKGVDPLEFFDKEKRWWRGGSESWFNFFGIPEAEVRNSIEQWERIGRDIEKSGSTRSAGYGGIGGGTHGTYVRWSALSGFVWLDVDDCAGGPMRIVRGRAEVVPTGVIFYPEIRLGVSEGHEGHSQHSKQLDRMDFLSVTWMQGTFLVPKDRIRDFSDYAAGLGEYNNRFAFMNETPFLEGREDVSESEPKTFELPVYPAGYEQYLKRPVRGSVTSIGKAVRRVNEDSDTYDELVTPFKIRLESAANLKVGQFLRVVGAEQGYDEAFEVRGFKGNVATVQNVRSVPKRNCVISAGDDCKVWDHVKLRSGLLLSSNGY